MHKVPPRLHYSVFTVNYTTFEVLIYYYSSSTIVNSSYVNFLRYLNKLTDAIVLLNLRLF